MATNGVKQNDIRAEYVMIPTNDPSTLDTVAVKDTSIPGGVEKDPPKRWRNLVAFWILGLCNNYGYVVMLSAAHDILKEEEGGDDNTDSLSRMLRGNGTSASDRNCNEFSTGAILLADIIPSLIIKFTAPFLPFYVHVRLVLCVLLSAGGFLIVAFSTSQWMSILGVISTSLCSGLGEVTLLQYSSFYDKNVVSTWSSGTGGAGVFGALSYALLKNLGPRNALLIMLIVPAVMAVAFWLILMRPDEQPAVLQQREVEQRDAEQPLQALRTKIGKVPGLMKYMIPLGLVYLFEYFINQGLYELLQYADTFLDYSEQYVWLQVDYQIGVFLSRSSVNLFHVKHIWLMSVFQLANVFIFSADAIFYIFPSFYIVLALVLWEGVLGGAAYVNTFYKISSEVPEEEKQFSMGVTSFADSIGITLAGVFAMLAHDAICKTDRPERY
ncbi:battenin isoform X2 [Atheta coriaria]|uniref:battenin isoform X2 n=1 Tax=Dalotia coriaria TaxID=877792 RepID=UPI0031F3388C